MCIHLLILLRECGSIVEAFWVVILTRKALIKICIFIIVCNIFTPLAFFFYKGVTNQKCIAFCSQYIWVHICTHMWVTQCILSCRKFLDFILVSHVDVPLGNAIKAQGGYWFAYWRINVCVCMWGWMSECGSSLKHF